MHPLAPPAPGGASQRHNLGLPEPALADTLEGLEEDIEDETGVVVRLPLDEEGADILLITPSADFFAEPHVDGLMGYAKVFHEAGVSWTLSSKASEAANFGLFIGSHDNMRKIALRIREAVASSGSPQQNPAKHDRRHATIMELERWLGNLRGGMQP